MAKKVEGYIKLQIPAGKATPAPPVGPALGQHGVNIVDFTKQFNARTADQGDLLIPVVITVYADRSFSFITKTPPASVLIKRACKIQSGSGTPNTVKVATITKDQLREIAETKKPDLNAASEEAAISMIAGTARSMGVTVEGAEPKVAPVEEGATEAPAGEAPAAEAPAAQEPEEEAPAAEDPTEEAPAAEAPAEEAPAEASEGEELSESEE